MKKPIKYNEKERARIIREGLSYFNKNTDITGKQLAESLKVPDQMGKAMKSILQQIADNKEHDANEIASDVTKKYYLKGNRAVLLAELADTFSVYIKNDMLTNDLSVNLKLSNMYLELSEKLKEQEKAETQLHTIKADISSLKNQISSLEGIIH